MIYLEEKRTIDGIESRSRTIETREQVRIHGRGLSDVARWLRENPAKWGANSSRNNGVGESWDLGVGYEGALRLAETGWNEGAKDLADGLRAFIPATGRQAKWGYSVAGSRPSVTRYLAGNPNNMRSRSKRKHGQAPLLHMVVNTVCSASIEATQMRNYGVAIVALIDKMEQSGRRIHLDVIMVTKQSGRDNKKSVRLAVGWNVKQAGDHCDLAAIAFALAHPGAFRRIGFALMERAPKACETSGYGSCLDVDAADVLDAPEGAILLDGVNHEPSRCNTPQDALRMATEQLNKAAVLAGHATLDDPLIELE